MRLDEVRDERPLSRIGERFSEYKRAAQRYRRERPRRFATLAAAAGLGGLGLGVWALVVGLADEPTSREGTNELRDWLVQVWEHLLRPTVGGPLISWSRDNLAVGTALPVEAPVILWATVGALVWLLGLGRSVYAKVVWPVFGAATAAMAHAGAAPGRETATVGVVVLLWLALSLPVYRRRVPRPLAEPRPTRREELLQSIEHYMRLLNAATPGSDDYRTIRRYLDADVHSLVYDAKLARAREWAEILNTKRGTAGAVLAGAGGLLLSLPMLAAGATGLGVLLAVFGVAFLAFGWVEHQSHETEPVRVGHTPTDEDFAKTPAPETTVEARGSAAAASTTTNGTTQ